MENFYIFILTLDLQYGANDISSKSDAINQHPQEPKLERPKM